MAEQPSLYEQSNPSDSRQPHLLPPTAGVVSRLNYLDTLIAVSCSQAEDRIKYPDIQPNQTQVFGVNLVRILAEDTNTTIQDFKKTYPDRQPPLRVPGSVERALYQYYEATRFIDTKDTVRRTAAEAYAVSAVETAEVYRSMFPEVEIAGQLQRFWHGERHDRAANTAGAVIGAYTLRLKSLESATAKIVLPPDADHQNAVRRWNAEVNTQTNAEKPYKRPRNKNKNGI